MRPAITNSLKGALGETYYKELCNQRGWAYCSLETLYNSNLDVVSFKKGFSRIKVKIPNSIKSEIKQIATPSNGSKENPSFVFDYLACKVGDDVGSFIVYPKEFCWAEVKTGLGIFSNNQRNTMYEIELPIAVFHIEDIFAKPHQIEMDWKIKSGSDMARSLQGNNISQKSYPKKDYSNFRQRKSYGSSYGNSNYKDKKRFFT